MLAVPDRAPAVGAVGGRGGRRVAAALAAMARHGLPPMELGGPVDVLLLPDGAEHPDVGPATALVRVRPAAADLDDDLDEALARVAPPARTNPVSGRSS
jgi:hypothetical protein